MRQIAAHLVKVIEYGKPNSLYAGSYRDALLAHQFREAGAIEMASWQDELCTDRWRSEREAPAIGVKHRYGDQKHIGAGECEGISLQRAQRVQIIGAVG